MKKKIIELEQIIKQKDFEILVLSQKLNDYNKNQFNINNNMNMNMMNPMMMNNNIINNNNWRDCYDNMGNNNNMNLFLYNMNDNNNINSKPKLNLIIKYKENEYNELVNRDEITGKFFKRFCRKLGIKFKNCKFINKNKSIIQSLTFAQSGIEDKSQISLFEVNSNNNSDDNESEDSDECECEGEKKNMIFASSSGVRTNIGISTNHSISTLIKKYIARRGMNYESVKKKLCFIYNGRTLKFDNLTKIKDFFPFESHPRIIVNDIDNLIGV